MATKTKSFPPSNQVPNVTLKQDFASYMPGQTMKEQLGRFEAARSTASGLAGLFYFLKEPCTDSNKVSRAEKFACEWKSNWPLIKQPTFVSK